MLKKIILSILKGLNRKANSVDWKNLRTTEPLSDIFGYDRGNQSIHRYYIDKFVEQNIEKIKGNVLEVGDSMYMDRYRSGIVKPNIIHYTETNQANAFKGDLTKPATLPQSEFDCFICTQTFNFIYDFQSAIRGAHAMLNNDGYLIATVSGIQQISKFDESRWGDYWRFTKGSCVTAFSEVFGAENVHVVTFGNVLASVAALEGLSASELTQDELNYSDPSYQLIVGIVAKK